jgi:hypothetical protein
VQALLLEGSRLYQGGPWADRLLAAARDWDSPLRLALAGRVKVGKSTLLNALVGVPIAPTDAGESTRVVTWYVWGPEPEVLAWLRPGSPAGIQLGGIEPGPAALDGDGDEDWADTDPTGAVPLPLRHDGPVPRVDLCGLEPEELDHVEVRLPSPFLRDLTLVDTPGMAPLTSRTRARDERFPTEPEGTGPVADAVLFLVRQLQPGDVDLLEAFRDPQGRPVPPANAVGVLTRADEIGAGRPDSLATARDLAQEYAQDLRLRPLLQTVVPVVGLLGQAAVTLTESEYAELVALATLPEETLAPMLRSAIRFVAPRHGLPVPPERRRRLVDRLGVFGIRCAVGVLRDGGASCREDLAGALSAASGMTELRWLIQARITSRAGAIKADAALRLLLHATGSDPVPGSRRLAAAAEQLRLGLHDVAELRTLNELRLGRLVVAEEQRRRMERVLGAEGAGVRTRLDLPVDAGPAEVEQALRVEHGHWQRLAGDLWTPPELQRAAAVVQRTCEGLLRELREGG